MKGARGWILLAGLGLLAVSVWQLMILSGAPAGRDPMDWLKFIQEETMYGKTWGARVAVLLLVIAPLYAFCERAKGGWGVAARGFLAVWVPLALTTALLQTQSVERLRELYADAIVPVSGIVPIPELGTPETPASPQAEMLFPVQMSVILWRSVIDPLMRVSLLVGMLGLLSLVGSIGRRMKVIVAPLAVIGFLVVLMLWSLATEATLTLLEGAILAALAFLYPPDTERPGFTRSH
jgi:hypothetical protein